MQILSRRTAAQLADIDERTLDRMHAKGTGPKRIQITQRRVGYEQTAFEKWLRSRAYASQAAAIAAGVAHIVSEETIAKAREARARTKDAKPATADAEAALKPPGRKKKKGERAG
jgi:predicted DNA-binding transcriptional regulator AlpA